MNSKEPDKVNNKYNLYTKEEIKKAIAELDKVKEQIEKRTEQINNLLKTSPDIKVNTIPGNITLKDLKPDTGKDINS